MEPDAFELKPGPVAGTLTVTARVKPATEKDGTRVRGERGDASRAYSRTIPVGWDADVKRAEARCEHGLLVVRVPRKKEERRTG